MSVKSNTRKTLNKAMTLLASSILYAQIVAAQQASVPRIDELGWAKEISEKRNSDYDQVNIGAKVLLLRPQYRKAYLQTDNLESFIKNHYSASEQSSDQKWADEQRQMLATMRTKNEKNLRPANYSERFFVGYLNNNFKGSSGTVCYKVFLELKDPLKDLTPDTYVEFAKYLSDKGFIGDSKIPLTPGQTRFYYNNIVIHAASMEHALYAEKLGQQFFADKLASTARGIDSYLTNEPQDWHHYLASNRGELPGLSHTTLQYLSYTVNDPWANGVTTANTKNAPATATATPSATATSTATSAASEAAPAAAAVGNTGLTSKQQRELDEAQRQADEILTRAKQAAAAYDAKADQTAREMQQTPGVGKGTWYKSAYSDSAIQSATQDMRDQSKYAMERAEREAADIIKRARMRAGLPADN
ncbi:MAG TPA: hypothetical protein V6C97_11845 [Oculatellaceae cyanobacterium]